MGKKHASQYANFGSLPTGNSIKETVYLLNINPPIKTPYSTPPFYIIPTESLGNITVCTLCGNYFMIIRT